MIFYRFLLGLAAASFCSLLLGACHRPQLERKANVNLLAGYAALLDGDSSDVEYVLSRLSEAENSGRRKDTLRVGYWEGSAVNTLGSKAVSRLQVFLTGTDPVTGTFEWQYLDSNFEPDYTVAGRVEGRNFGDRITLEFETEHLSALMPRMDLTCEFINSSKFPYVYHALHGDLFYKTGREEPYGYIVLNRSLALSLRLQPAGK